MQITPLRGLIAATYTPLNEDGSLALPGIPPLVDHLLLQGVAGLYVCGSTGEGVSLSTAERKQVAEAFLQATNRRVPVIIQVGHNCVADAVDLAAHAQTAGAAIVSATCPSYFKISTVDALIDCMRTIAAAASNVPFYYYHIPVLTGSKLDMVDFLQRGGATIPNLCGLKFTDSALHEFQQCIELEAGRFDVVWGSDEMLLGALATGAKAAIGSTYNIAAPLYLRLLAAFAAGDLDAARSFQSQSIQMIRTIGRFAFHPAMKQVLKMQGLDVGGTRSPQMNLTTEEITELHEALEAIGFFEWSR